MSSSPEQLEEHDARERTSERTSALTPRQELAHADGYRWAALDLTDLDPPTWFPPH